MKTTILLKTSLTALAFVVLAAPQAVHAATSAQPVSKVHVQINDLNLANAAGVEALYQRLSNASRVVCGNYSDLKSVGSLKQLRINKECFDSTLANALVDANFSALAQTIEVSNRSQG